MDQVGNRRRSRRRDCSERPGHQGLDDGSREGSVSMRGDDAHGGREMTAEMLCAFVDGESECEAPATFSLRFKTSHAPGNFQHIESCDFHLAKLARGIPELYAVE